MKKKLIKWIWKKKIGKKRQIMKKALPTIINGILCADNTSELLQGLLNVEMFSRFHNCFQMLTNCLFLVPLNTYMQQVLQSIMCISA